MWLLGIRLYFGDKWYISVGAYLAVVTLVLLAVGLSLRLIWRLYCARRVSITTEQAASGEVDSAQLSDAALTNRLVIGLKRTHGRQDSTSDSTRDLAGRALRVAEELFLLNWSRCQADVTAIWRAGVLMFMLSMVIPAVSMKKIYELNTADKITDLECLSLTAMEVSTQLGIGWCVSVALYAAFCVFARALDQRRNSWEAFSSIVRTQIAPARTESGGQSK